MACTICGGPLTIYRVDRWEADRLLLIVYLCSSQCLVDFAWRERLKEPGPLTEKEIT